MAPIVLLNETETYTAPTFEDTNAIIISHAQSRFGRVTDIDALLDGTPEDKQSYINGVVAMSIFILFIFAIWTIILITMKARGEKIGCTAAKIPELPDIAKKSYVEIRTQHIPMIQDKFKSFHEGFVKMQHDRIPELGDEAKKEIEMKGEKFIDEYGKEKIKNNVDDALKEVQKPDTTEAKVTGTAEKAQDLPASSTPSANISIEKSRESTKGASVILVETTKEEIAEGIVVVAAAGKDVLLEVEDEVEQKHNEELVSYGQKMAQYHHLVMWSRILFLLCAFGNIVSTSIFISNGVGSLRRSIMKNVVNSLHKTDDTLYEVDELLGNFVFSTENATNATEELADEAFTGNYCLKVTRLDQAPFVNELQGMISQMRGVLATIPVGVGEIQADLQKVFEKTHEIRQKILSLDWVFSFAIFIGVLQLIISIVLAGGVITAWLKQYPAPFLRVESYVIMPLFIFLVFVSALLACVFVCVSVMGSDFCFGGPDEKIIQALKSSSMKPVTVDIIAFYLKGCKEKLVSAVIKNVSKVAIQQGGQALIFAHDLIESVSDFEVPRWLAICGTDGSLIRNLLGVIHGLLHLIVAAAQDTREVLKCENINPIYTEIVYQAVCYNGVTGVRTIFSTQLAIAIFSMSMVTLRLSWQQVEEEMHNAEKK